MSLEHLIIIGGMALAAASIRLGSLLLLQHSGLPPRAKQWLKHLPAAVFSALAVPAILLPNSQFDLSIHNHYLIAAIAAIILAKRYKNFMLTVGGSMLVMICLRGGAQLFTSLR